jgi:hypothetical protein
MGFSIIFRNIYTLEIILFKGKVCLQIKSVLSEIQIKSEIGQFAVISVHAFFSHQFNLFMLLFLFNNKQTYPAQPMAGFAQCRMKRTVDCSLSNTSNVWRCRCAVNTPVCSVANPDPGSGAFLPPGSGSGMNFS